MLFASLIRSSLPPPILGKDSITPEYQAQLGTTLRMLRSHEQAEERVLNPVYAQLGLQGMSFLKDSVAFSEQIALQLALLESVAMGNVPTTKDEVATFNAALKIFTSNFEQHSSIEEKIFVPAVIAKLSAPEQATLCSDMVREMSAAFNSQGFGAGPHMMGKLDSTGAGQPSSSQGVK